MLSVEELSTVPNKEPTFTVSPSLQQYFPNTPLVGEGTSTFTLSVSSSTSGSSAETFSPCDFNHFETVASVTDSPKCWNCNFFCHLIFKYLF